MRKGLGLKEGLACSGLLSSPPARRWVLRVTLAVRAQEAGTKGPTDEQRRPREAAYQEKLDALLGEGPTTVEISSNSKLELPEH